MFYSAIRFRSAIILLAVLFGPIPSALAATAEKPNDASVKPSSTHDANENASPRRTPDRRSIELLIGYCVLIAVASMAGGALPLVMTLTHTRMQLMISLVGGLMLGIGVFHMLPHAMRELTSVEQCAFWMMLGILAMFFLIRAFHFHDHGVAEDPHHSRHTPAGHAHHDHDHDDGRCRPGSSHPLSWVGIAAGLTLHTVIDGIALAASVHSDAGRGASWWLFGLGAFLAIVLHKPLDAVSITSLMTAGGWSRRWRIAVNAAFGLICPVGVVLFYLGLSRFAPEQSVIVGCTLAFAAGVFICIALSDLLPEMEFHSHSRLLLTAFLLLGIAIAWLVSRLEPDHGHAHESTKRSESRQSIAERFA